MTVRWRLHSGHRAENDDCSSESEASGTQTEVYFIADDLKTANEGRISLALWQQGPMYTSIPLLSSVMSDKDFVNASGAKMAYGTRGRCTKTLYCGRAVRNLAGSNGYCGPTMAPVMSRVQGGVKNIA